MSLQGKKSVKILKMPDGRYMKYDNTNYKYAVTGLTFFLIFVGLLVTALVQGLTWVSELLSNETASIWTYFAGLILLAGISGYFLGEADTDSIVDS